MYIAFDIDKAPKPHELKKKLKSKYIDKLIKAMKVLILCIIHNPKYPRMLMDVFTNIIPK